MNFLKRFRRSPHDQDPVSTNPAAPFNAAETPDVGFVACIEGGVLEAQTLLLFDSIRRHAGRFSNCSLYALSPRAGHSISTAGRRRLDQLGAHYTDEILNTECPEYGSANRVAAAAHIENTRQHKTLVILDSDTLFLREPHEFILPAEIDVAVRPVDVKGMSTSGPTDSFDIYWQELCRCCGARYDEIPWRESFVDRQGIKANYNAGLVVVRSELGILRRWADFFFASIRQGLRPPSTDKPFRTGTGLVEPAAAKLWGSNQAALSLAIWNTTQRVRELPSTYNYPLTLHKQIERAVSRTIFPQLVHVHYHWMLAPDALARNPLWQRSGPLSRTQSDWLRAATPIG
jgi:hypothetical protein